MIRLKLMLEFTKRILLNQCQSLKLKPQEVSLAHYLVHPSLLQPQKCNREDQVWEEELLQNLGQDLDRIRALMKVKVAVLLKVSLKESFKET
jgi:hypothetical protein